MGKSTQKPGPSSGFNFGSISSILQIILAAFDAPQKPLTPLPPILTMLSGKVRTGLSGKQIAARIISRQSEAGAPAGDIFSSSNNIMESMEAIRADEIINAILTEAKVEVVVPPGIPITSVGVGNFGAPVVAQGYTTSYKAADGVVR